MSAIKTWPISLSQDKTFVGHNGRLIITEPENHKTTWGDSGDRILPILRDRGMGPCDREWFLNGQRQPWARGGRTWPALPLAPGHTAASQHQAMTAGNHISQPSRWVHPSGSATDVAPALSPRPVQSNASMTDANAQPGLQHGVGFLPAGPLPTGQRPLTGSPREPHSPRGTVRLVPCIDWQTSDWPAA
jgi:hypothetical protein